MKKLTLELDGNSFDYSVPGEWNDLSQDQLIYLIRMVQNQVTAEEVKLKLLLYCIDGGVKKYNDRIDGRVFLLKIRKDKFWLSPAEVNAMTSVLDFLFKETKDGVRIDPKLTINKFKKAHCGCITVYGPSDGLVDITYQQFADLQIWSTRVEKSSQMLDKFISIIYKRKNGESSTKLISKMAPSVKTAILWFYIGCLQLIQQKFPKVFQGGDSTGGDVVDGQMRIYDALAHNKLADKDKVKSAELYDALYTMQCAAEQVKKMEDKRK